MTKGSPCNARVATVSRLRKSALMGAAATALITAFPALATETSHAERATLQAAIRKTLRSPANTLAWPEKPGVTPQERAQPSAISLGNGDDITVGSDEAALRHVESVEDVDLVNTGNLTGGVGIEVSTGEIDVADAALDDSASYDFNWDYAFLYDDAGNHVLDSYGYYQQIAMSHITVDMRSTILNPDPLASRISIENSGSIAFSGLRGIQANNPAGQSIVIANSGDITSTQEIAGRVGIYASTESLQNRFGRTVTPGEFTYNAYGQLTGVVSPNEIREATHFIDMERDGGAIDIRNTGDIDMGPAQGYAGYGVRASVGIYTRGDGGTTILNEGNITVGDYSNGILALSTATTSITNAGRITVGNASSGILFDESRGSADFYRPGGYRLGGDVYILNTGDIVGGERKTDTPQGEYTDVGGIRVFSLGTNHEGLASLAHLNELMTEYNELLGEDVFTPYDIPGVRLYDTTVVNQGRIELQDGARGIFVRPNYGHATAVNSGTIIVGEGTTNFRGNYHDPAAGIFLSNLNVDGYSPSSLTSINTATGIILTGDDGAGLTSLSYRGDAITLNEGVIVTGDGATGQITDYYGETYDKLFHSHGMYARSVDYAAGTTAYAWNAGNITVGDLAVGSLVIGGGYPVLDPMRSTALNVNEGVLTSGDNSAGMHTLGTNATTVNIGSVATGSYDISAFHPNRYSAERFAVGRNAVSSSGAWLSEVINYGSITAGDGKVGASARNTYDWGYGARVLQNSDGVISTGDHSTGVLIRGIELAQLDNQGEISVGDHSIGVDITVGSAILYLGETQLSVTEGAMQAGNTGLIETGDQSVGIRMNGDREDVPWNGWMTVPSPYYPYFAYEPASGTVDITSAVYLANLGTIRVGAGSTAVDITGRAAGDEGLHLFNAGTLDAGRGGGTAIRLNADNELGSYAVNVGTISGDMIFGAGDDRLVNTLRTDNAGRVTHSGNLVLNGTTIDFGAGSNRLENLRGQITIAGGDNLIAGADLIMTRARIEARNGAADNTLTIDGNLSGDFVFGADVDASGTDQLVITGNVAGGSSMSVLLNPLQQLAGDTELKVITVGGVHEANPTVVAGVTGRFADSLLATEVSFSEATGEITVAARFGMGHMATSASAATSMAQHWWMQSAGSLDQRNLQQLAGLEDSGLSVWAGVFQEEGTIEPGNDLQDVSFDQKLFGLQTGIDWQGDIGGGTFSAGPMFSTGSASASQNANLASARGDATAYGIHAGYRSDGGLYLNAAWQRMSMDIDFRTPRTMTNATAHTDAEGDGFQVELGYVYPLKSGLTLAPQLQYSSVTLSVDDFSSSDDVYELTGLGGKHTQLRAGLSLFKTFETANGSVTPLLDLSYLDALDGSSALTSNGLAFENDSSGSGFRGEVGISGRYKGWDIAGRVGLADTRAIKSALSSNLTLRYRW